MTKTIDKQYRTDELAIEISRNTGISYPHDSIPTIDIFTIQMKRSSSYAVPVSEFVNKLGIERTNTILNALSDNNYVSRIYLSKGKSVNLIRPTEKFSKSLEDCF